MSYLKKIVYNCHQATFLIEKKQIGRLKIRERIELRIHLIGCSVCRIFQKQSILINRMVKSFLHTGTASGHSLENTFKEQLKDRIEAARRKK